MKKQRGFSTLSCDVSASPDFGTRTSSLARFLAMACTSQARTLASLLKRRIKFGIRHCKAKTSSNASRGLRPVLESTKILIEKDVGWQYAEDLKTLPKAETLTGPPHRFKQAASNSTGAPRCQSKREVT